MQIGVQGGGGRLGLVGQGSLLEECRFEESRGWLRTDKEKKAVEGVVCLGRVVVVLGLR
jgi:hypothetical protein